LAEPSFKRHYRFKALLIAYLQFKGERSYHNCKKHTMINLNCLFGGFLHNSDLKGTIEQKGMTFDHDFGYSFPLFSALLNKRE